MVNAELMVLVYFGEDVMRGRKYTVTKVKIKGNRTTCYMLKKFE